MPITISIEGAEDAPMVEETYAAFGTVDILAGTTSYGYGSVDILANVLTEALQTVNIQQETLRGVLGAVNIGEYDLYSFVSSIDVSTGDSFLILADIIQSELAPGTASSRWQRITARLLVDGDEVPIKSFQYQAPSGKLGSILNLTLADPDKTQVPAGAEIDFSLIVTTSGGDIVYPLMESGKMQERDYKVTWKGGGSNPGPVDELTISALDVIADRFTLAPRRPIVMFDPTRSRYDRTESNVQNAVRDITTGETLLPVIEPVSGLTMRQILNRAYTGIGGMGAGLFSGEVPWSGQIITPGTDQLGMAFDAVITNIPDYRVRRADFSIEQGWHDGAQPVVAMFAPVYFERDNVLYILDVERPLPFGVTPRNVTLSEHKSLSERIAFKVDANAVLLTYQYQDGDPYEQSQRLSREVYVEGEWEESGTEGEAGYSRSRTDKWVIEWYEASDPTNVLASYDKEVINETQQTVIWYVDDVPTTYDANRTTHRETIEYTYNKELKTGHTRTVEAAFSHVDAPLSLYTVERESCIITWADDPYQPGVKIQDRVIIDVDGLCYIDDATGTVYEAGGAEEITRYYPVLLAQQSGIVSADMALTADLVPIKRIRQTARRVKGRQMDVEVIEIDFLNNTLHRSYTEPTTGSPTTDPYAQQSRTVMIRDLTSEGEIGPRIPVGVNAYELPRDMAIELGERTLYRFKNPLMQMPLDLPGVDFAIDRGSIIKGQLRDTTYTANPFFVTGYSISGEGLHKDNAHRIRMSLEATELLPQ